MGLPLGAPRAEATYGRLAERGAGKDTTTGHWEMMGVVLERPFPTYPDGFPPEVIEPFERAVGRRVLCNRPASGTAIIEELGDEHVATGRPIVYTSADSVFQIACHEDVVPVTQLYEWCEVARGILQGAARRRPGHRAAVRRRRRAATRARRGAATSRSSRPGPRTSTCCRSAACRVGGRRQDRRDLRAARRGRGRPHHRQHRRHRRLHAAPRARWRTGCCSPTSWTSTRSGATATTWTASPEAWRPWTRRCPEWEALLRRRGRDDPLRRPRGGPHHGEHRPLAGVLAAAGARPAPGRYDGAQEDVGATAFAQLTGEEPPLPGGRSGDGGSPQGRRPSGGRGRRASGGAARRVAPPRRRRLRLRAGGPAGGAARRGRGPATTRSAGRQAAVPGHQTCCGSRRARRGGRELRLALACGRPHRYEGWTDAGARDAGPRPRGRRRHPPRADQLVRRAAARRWSPAAWSSARDVVDLQGLPPARSPERLRSASGDQDAARVAAALAASPPSRAPAIYVAVCGPQFETPAEVAWLARYGGRGRHVGRAGGSRGRRAPASSAVSWRWSPTARPRWARTRTCSPPAAACAAARRRPRAAVAARWPELCRDAPGGEATWTSYTT